MFRTIFLTLVLSSVSIGSIGCAAAVPETVAEALAKNEGQGRVMGVMKSTDSQPIYTYFICSSAKEEVKVVQIYGTAAGPRVLGFGVGESVSCGSRAELWRKYDELSGTSREGEAKQELERFQRLLNGWTPK